MGCTTLTVTEPVEPVPVVEVSKYGFAEIEFTNRMFDEPCEETDIIGSREAIGIAFTLKNVSPFTGAKIRFTVNYLRPGATVKTSWVSIFELTNGTYQRYMYNTDLKYIKGRYSGLTLGVDFLK